MKTGVAKENIGKSLTVSSEAPVVFQDEGFVPPDRFGMFRILDHADGFFWIAPVVVEFPPDDRVAVVRLPPLNVSKIRCAN